MMADADRNSVLVEHGADIMWVRAIDVERNDAEAVLPARHHLHVGNARQPVDGVTSQQLLVLGDRLAADAFDEIERQAEPDRTGNIGSPGLETVRRLQKFGL